MVKNHILYDSFSDWVFKVSKAEDCFIYDQDGKQYLDFTSGWNVTNLGWNHPEVNEAVVEQAKKNVYVPMWTADSIQEEYAAKLIASLPKELSVACRATGGTEANEEALKLARAFTGRSKILGFNQTYHGQSLGTLAIGNKQENLEEISPLVPDFVHLDYPSLYPAEKSEQEVLANFVSQLEKVLSKKDIASVVTEAGIITGWGSVYVAPKGFLTEIRRLTEKYGTLLILDEVGTGFSRTGKLFGSELENVVPDMMTFAKGISNGAAAIGAVVTKEEIARECASSAHIVSTFGWTPVACAAALKTLEIHQRDKVWEQAAEKGNYLMKLLKEKIEKHPSIGDIRGMGLEIGIDFRDKDKLISVVGNSFSKGLHLIHDGVSVIQLMPPLTITEDLIDQAVQILVESMGSY